MTDEEKENIVNMRNRIKSLSDMLKFILENENLNDDTKEMILAKLHYEQFADNLY